VGSYRSRRPLNKKEREWAAAFCDGLVQSFKNRKETMSKSNETEFTNMVFLAGFIKSMKLQEENAFLLIDVTGKDSGGATKWVPCTVYKAQELLDRLDNYHKDDFIKIRGYVRAWSQKKDEEWKNAVDIRITEIKSEDPQPRERAERKETRRREPGDDDIPF